MCLPHDAGRELPVYSHNVVDSIPKSDDGKARRHFITVSRIRECDSGWKSISMLQRRAKLYVRVSRGKRLMLQDPLMAMSPRSSGCPGT